MSIRSAMEAVYMCVELLAASASKLSITYSDIVTSYKRSSTKKGNNHKSIKARRKKNKNKKTQRK